MTLSGSYNQVISEVTVVSRFDGGRERLAGSLGKHYADSQVSPLVCLGACGWLPPEQ